LRKRFQAVDYFRLIFKKEKGLIDGHLQYIGYRLLLIGNFNDMLLKAIAAASFAGQEDIRDKLHFHLNFTLSLAYIATAALNIERERRRFQSQSLCRSLSRK